MDTKNSIDRSGLDFSELARERFSFLEELGFREMRVEPTLVTYKNGEISVEVYHGRKSYEIGFNVTYRDHRCSIGQILGVENPVEAKHYQNYCATTRMHVEQGLDQLAVLVKRHGTRALRADQEFLRELEASRIRWQNEFALDVRESQLRPKAAEAFQQGEYAQAVELYEQIVQRLSPAELKKLDLARTRSKREEKI